VRAHVWRRDQYERAVATVYVRRPPFFFPKKDVGLELLKRGLATTYEGKTGAEFGGPELEAKYKAVEALARKKKKGMWALEGAGTKGNGMGGGLFGLGRKKESSVQGGSQPFETPKAYKDRLRQMELGKEKGAETVVKGTTRRKV
jgi:hypothetical protein